MIFNVTFYDRPASSEPLQVARQISGGKLSVFQVYSASRQAEYAVKIFPKNDFGMTQYNKEKLMLSLNHPNIIECVPIMGQYDKFYALLTEYAKHGDFFDIVTKGFLTNEILVRSYFHQLIQGLEYIHSEGVAHLDLKLENIMLGADFQLKIIDFDQSQNLADQSVTSGGTNNYRAPEIQNGTCKDLAAADIYSAGILLYSFLAHNFPFREEQDPTLKDINSYSTFVYNNKYFWNGKGLQKKRANFFSDDFKELVNGMLCKDPSSRLTLKQIKESRWFQGPILDAESLKMEMSSKF